MPRRTSLLAAAAAIVLAAAGSACPASTARPAPAQAAPGAETMLHPVIFGYKSHGPSERYWQDYYARECGRCRQGCLVSSRFRFVACRPSRDVSGGMYVGPSVDQVACTAAINACLANCQSIYCSRSGR